MVLVTGLTSVPIFGTIFVSTSTTEPDLAELAPINDRAGSYVVLNWSALLQDHPPELAKTKLTMAAGTDVQALGYMLDGDRPTSKGEWVREFILLPEAGNLMHPAHRIRDQMIDIYLEDGKGIQFSPRALTWVWGCFRVSNEPSIGSKPLYTLERARAKPADRVDIKRYFK